MAAENAGHDDDGDCQLAKRKNDLWLKDSDGWVCVPLLGCTLNRADSLFVVHVQGGRPVRSYAMLGCMWRSSRKFIKPTWSSEG